MGILDELLGSTMAGQDGTNQAATRQFPQQASGGAMSSTLMALLPVVLAMLANRGGGTQQTEGGPASGLGNILGQMMGGGAQPGGGGLGGMLGGMLGGGAASGAGGLGGLLQQMANTGYGEHAQSWVGTGQNMPIGPDDLQQILGRDGIAQIARQAGVSEADASQGLSALLPEVVNHATPGGEVPDVESLMATMSDLSRRFGAPR
jgi:uncharacterized protein YidB (DUF937 family)